MFCDECSNTGFITMKQDGYEFVFDCHCRTVKVYGSRPRYFEEDTKKEETPIKR